MHLAGGVEELQGYFKNIMKLVDAKIIGDKTLIEHGLTDWTFKLDNAKRRFGVCRYGPKIISMSRELIKVNDEAQFMDTLLHEIAHALVGSGHGHNHIWKAKCREIGCRPVRCYSSELAKGVKSKYLLVCNNCDYKKKQHRNSGKEWACGDCCKKYSNGRFDRKYLLELKEN